MSAPAQFKKLVGEAETALAKAKSALAIEKLRTKYLGRKGLLTTALRQVGSLPAAKRGPAGKAGNAAKAKLEAALKKAEAGLGSDTAVSGQFDPTLPGAPIPRGHRHPVSLVMDQIAEIMHGLGFSMIEGPEVEDDWHNFEALNIPPDHPGRDMQDTFYLDGSQDDRGVYNLLPRTQTTAVTVRGLKDTEPPARLFTLGKVYRNETEDATHGAVFHQLDGVMVDAKVSFADLKGVLTNSLQQLLGSDVRLRFRPSYFPFTEPSAEIDISIPSIRNGEWLEIAGAGSLHPNVMKNVGYDSTKYQSFAWAFGVERIAMLKYGLDDLRPFVRPDLRILEQF